MKKLLMVTVAALLVISITSCGNKEKNNGSDENSDAKSETISDADGNKYPVVSIGEQKWMAANLETKTFNNGDKIVQAKSVSDAVKYNSSKTPAWCYYYFEEGNGKEFGILYNYFAVSDSRGLVPEGWRVSTADDWKALSKEVGNNGDKLKGKDDWKDGGVGTDDYGFNAVPSGMMYDFGGELGLHSHAYYWTTSKSDDATRPNVYYYLSYNKTDIASFSSMPEYFLAVRCVKQ